MEDVDRVLVIVGVELAVLQRLLESCVSGVASSD
jgi:hypothetical protein